jgi:hypothetical protein
MKTETPRTDRAESEYDDGSQTVVYAEFARELERENAQLREAIKWAEPYVPKQCETRRMIESFLPNKNQAQL